MHLTHSGRLSLAATDLGKFLGCKHAIGLEIEVLFKKRDEPRPYEDPFKDLLRKRGEDHEKGYLVALEAAGVAVLDLKELRGSDAVARTVAVASPRLLEPDCKTPRQIRLANAMCSYSERNGSSFRKATGT